jgi:hypothetical protein
MQIQAQGDQEVSTKTQDMKSPVVITIAIIYRDVQSSRQWPVVERRWPHAWLSLTFITDLLWSQGSG